MSDVAIALSGGGVRAMLFGLGALRAVIRARSADRTIAVLAAVSGGAMGAAYAASRIDVGSATVETYDAQVLRPALRTITRRSLMFGTWHVPVLIAVLVAVLIVAVLFGAWGFGLPAYVRAAAVAVSLASVIVMAGWRGIAIEEGIRSALFAEDPFLSDVDQSTLLVLQATDLASGEATYLTPRGVRSWRWSTAPVGNLKLVRAARAAATFPVVFPAVHLGPLEFADRDRGAPRKLALVDGGVYDNMGSEWLLNEDRTPRETYKIVVNASGNLSVSKTGFGTFGLGELRVLLREKDIQYDGTTAPRRRWLSALFRLGWQRGTLVRIDGDLHRWVKQFTNGNDERAARARSILGSMDAIADPGVWLRWSENNPRVMTSLGRLKPSVALDLARAGYLVTAIQTHVLEAWPAPETCDPAALFVDALDRGGP
jgi:predicted acylesterase/phospholipase RssA